MSTVPLNAPSFNKESLFHSIKKAVFVGNQNNVVAEQDTSFDSTIQHFKHINDRATELKVEASALSKEMKLIIQTSINVQKLVFQLLYIKPGQPDQRPTDLKPVVVPDVISLAGGFLTTIRTLDEQLWSYSKLLERITERKKLQDNFNYYNKKLADLKIDRDERASKDRNESSSDRDKWDRNQKKLNEAKEVFFHFHEKLNEDLTRVIKTSDQMYGTLAKELLNSEQQFVNAYSASVRSRLPVSKPDIDMDDGQEQQEQQEQPDQEGETDAVEDIVEVEEEVEQTQVKKINTMLSKGGSKSANNSKLPSAASNIKIDKKLTTTERPLNRSNSVSSSTKQKELSSSSISSIKAKPVKEVKKQLSSLVDDSVEEPESNGSNHSKQSSQSSKSNQSSQSNQVGQPRIKASRVSNGNTTTSTSSPTPLIRSKSAAKEAKDTKEPFKEPKTVEFRLPETKSTALKSAMKDSTKTSNIKISIPVIESPILTEQEALDENSTPVDEEEEIPQSPKTPLSSQEKSISKSISTPRQNSDSEHFEDPFDRNRK
ncbi:MAG: hypothetical protein Sylvanvirus3_14 [Sylvanvirus sp.]|uniref:BAR domain-containing protein n=1 Tax=Sylvanvirus sp. TaxID=2487774 RepID=A0A3G5AHC6_9VIRU|nr:MAG: hypothetical protein Sylvanvirus3_14 [Sylvanvirus sp.]